MRFEIRNLFHEAGIDNDVLLAQAIQASLHSDEFLPQRDQPCIDHLGIAVLVGERVPDLPNARAALVGLGPGSFTRARVYRALSPLVNDR